VTTFTQLTCAVTLEFYFITVPMSDGYTMPPCIPYLYS